MYLLRLLWMVYILHVKHLKAEGGSRKVAKFISESQTFYKNSKATKMLSFKNFATLLDPPLRKKGVFV